MEGNYGTSFKLLSAPLSKKISGEYAAKLYFIRIILPMDFLQGEGPARMRLRWDRKLE